MNKYYYLFNGRQIRKGIKLLTLKRDLERGVKHINTRSYMTENLCGVTQFDIRFLEQISKLIWLNGKRAVMDYDPRHSWILRVYTHNGYSFVFNGVSSGYGGEGTRGAYDILKLFGFNDKQCKKVFQRCNLEGFTVVRN